MKHSHNIDPNNVIVTGHWGGEPIWRFKTPEEMAKGKLSPRGTSPRNRKTNTEGFELWSSLIKRFIGENNG